MSSPRIQALAAHPLPWTWKDGIELEIRDASGELVAVVRGKAPHQFGLCHVIVSAVNQHEALTAEAARLRRAAKSAQKWLNSLRSVCDDREWRQDWQGANRVLDTLNATLERKG